MAKDRIDVVQVWRFLAAALVVVAHAYSRMARTLPERAQETWLFRYEPMQSWGHLGVDFFFVISGFIMAWTSWAHFGAPGAARAFLHRRLARIVPVYWIATTLGVLLIVAAPSLFSYGQRLEWGWILASYGFIPATSPGGFVAPVIGLGWTLNYEMYFYAAFAVALLLPRRVGLLSLAGFLVGSVALGLVIAPSSPFLRQATGWLLLEFLCGVGLGAIARSRGMASFRWQALAAGVGVAMFAASLVLHEDTDPSRFFWWGLPSALLLYASLGRPHAWLQTTAGRWAVQLGNGSYSIYLFQVFALPAFAILLRLSGVTRFLPFDALVIVLAACSITASYVVYLAIEKPLTRRLQAPRQPTPASLRVAA